MNTQPGKDLDLQIKVPKLLDSFVSALTYQEQSQHQDCWQASTQTATQSAAADSMSSDSTAAWGGS